MGRYIPSQLEDHLQQDATTTCYLLKIAPVTPGFSAYGITSLDQDVDYDDGTGLLTYHAAVGMIPADVAQRGDLSVDNTEIPSLLPEYDVPVSEAAIRAGAYDNAQFALMLVNYEDLGAGHTTLHSGTIGQVKIRSDGLSFIQELRGLSACMKQSVCSKDSLTCRAIFGSQPPGSSTPGPQVQRDWCGYDAESLLVASTVATVGLENTRTFTVTSASGWTEDMLSPGLWIWDTGLNAGRSYEIESNTAGGSVSLAYETDFPIQPGDTGRRRPDCNKQARDEAKGCKRWFVAAWIYHFRGEPDTPIGDADAIAVPGASSGPGQGGRSYQPLTSDA